MPQQGARTLVLIAASLLFTAGATAQGIEVRVDARVELVSALFRFGGRPEYRQGRVPRWNAALDSLAAAHAAHPTLVVARRLAGPYDVGYFAPLSLAIHLAPEPLRLGDGLATAPSLHRTWTTYPDSTTRFVADFAAFSRDVRFDRFLGQQREVVEAAASRLRALVDDAVVAPWFRDFWGDTTIVRVTVVPGLTTATASYGLDVVRPDGRREAFTVIGVSTVDGTGLPTYDSTHVATVLHELNHPYVTGALRGAPRALRAVADSLHGSVAAAMRAQGYGSGDAMLNEALVRAAVVRYLAVNVSPAAAAVELAKQQQEGFTFLPDVVRALEEYGSRRAEFPTFTDFLPVLIERLRTIGAGARDRPHEGA